jgi:4-hydroxybenzoate polyprenyltransferase
MLLTAEPGEVIPLRTGFLEPQVPFKLRFVVRVFSLHRVAVAFLLSLGLYFLVILFLPFFFLYFLFCVFVISLLLSLPFFKRSHFEVQLAISDCYPRRK